MKSISDPEDLEFAWDQQYARLAERFSRMLSKQRGFLVEIGCGKGQLTIPLAERLPRCQIIGVDRFRDPTLKPRPNYYRTLLVRERTWGSRSSSATTRSG